MQHKKSLRIISLLSVAVLVAVCIIPMSASSANLNYLDYMTNVRVNGELNIVTASFPCSVFRLDIWSSLNDTQDTFFNVPKVSYAFMPADICSYTIKIEPSTKDYLYIGNVPLDTEINLYLDVSSYEYGLTPPEYETVPIPEWQMNVGSVKGHFYFYDWDYKRVTSYCNYDVDAGFVDPPDNYTSSFLLNGSVVSEDEMHDIQKNAPYFRPALFLNDVTFSEAANVTFFVPKYEVVFHIDTLVLGGKYGELLDSINDKLKEQGKYIDPDTGDVKKVPSSIPDADYSPDMDSVMDEIEDIQSGISKSDLDAPDLSGISFDFSGFLSEGTFLTYIGAFQLLWSNKLLATFFIVISTVSLISYFFLGKK